MKKSPVIVSKSGKRLVKIKLNGPVSASRNDLSEEQLREISDTESACKYVMSHSMYNLILDSLREGTKLTEISRWLAHEGYLTINETTMTRYLSLFRKKHRDSIYSKNGKATFDTEFPSDLPELDTEAELLRLLRMQKRRIHSEFALEQTMGKALNSTVKEIEQAKEILKLLAIVRGQVKPTGSGPVSNGSPISDGSLTAEVRDKFSELRKDETQRDRMAAMVNQLLGGSDE